MKKILNTLLWTTSTVAAAASLGACSDSATASSTAADAGTQEHDASADVISSGQLTDGGTDGAAGMMPVTIPFKAKVGSDDFGCGKTYASQGSAATPVTPADLRFFIDKISPINDKGVEVPVTFEARTPWQTPDVALLDFEDGTGECNNGNADLNAKVTGSVPAGTYRGIVFSNGVPESLNHGDPAAAPAPLQADGMSWGWLYGYKFLAAEMVSASTPDGGSDAGAPGVGLFHLGSVGCNNAVDGGSTDYNQAPTVACAQQNRNLIRLPEFDPASSTIVFDVGALFAATDMTMSSQCHSEGLVCPSLFANVGLSFETGGQLPSQSAYRVE